MLRIQHTSSSHCRATAWIAGYVEKQLSLQLIPKNQGVASAADEACCCLTSQDPRSLSPPTASKSPVTSPELHYIYTPTCYSQKISCCCLPDLSARTYHTGHSHTTRAALQSFVCVYREQSLESRSHSHVVQLSRRIVNGHFNRQRVCPLRPSATTHCLPLELLGPFASTTPTTSASSLEMSGRLGTSATPVAILDAPGRRDFSSSRVKTSQYIPIYSMSPENCAASALAQLRGNCPYRSPI
jgi:hypothetical protein